MGASDRVVLHFGFGVYFCIFPGFYYLREFAFVSEAFGGVDAESFLASDSKSFFGGIQSYK